MKTQQGISFFEKYLTLWVALCIVAGIAIGELLPAFPQMLEKWEYANVSIPIAILIWIMIFPMMLKIDFGSVVNAVKMPKGLAVTLTVNWLIKPFTLFGIAWLFFYVIFKAFIPAELADEYLAGAVLLGAAPCTAMVFVWSHLTNGNPAYTLVQVAINDFNNNIRFRTHCSPASRSYRYSGSMGYAVYVGSIVCGHSVGGRFINKTLRD